MLLLKLQWLKDSSSLLQGFVLGDFTTLLTKATQMAFADVRYSAGSLSLVCCA